MLNWLFGETNNTSIKPEVETDVKSIAAESRPCPQINWTKVTPAKFTFLHKSDFVALVRERDNNIWLIQDAEVYHCHCDKKELSSLQTYLSFQHATGWIARGLVEQSRDHIYQFHYGRNQTCKLERLNPTSAQYFINLYSTHMSHSCTYTDCTGEGHCCDKLGCL